LALSNYPQWAKNQSKLLNFRPTFGILKVFPEGQVSFPCLFNRRIGFASADFSLSAKPFRLFHTTHRPYYYYYYYSILSFFLSLCFAREKKQGRLENRYLAVIWRLRRN